MRIAVLVAAALVPALVPSLVQADAPRPLVVWKDTVIPAPPGAQPLTTISHTLYLNNCLPGGCALTPGQDDSRTNRSSIVQSARTLNAWTWGDQHWNDLVQCVKDTFLPFHIDVVTTDPGSSVNHAEVMVGGFSTQLNATLSAGGVAPYVSCGATRENGLSFVFAEQTSDLNYLCAAVAQEASHVWGLDHELNAKDPMTYLDLTSLKRFQLADAQCGEELANPRPCRCGGTTQNSFQYLAATFGKADLPPATIALQSPSDGAWVKPAFPIRAEMTTLLGARDVTLSIDSTQTSMLDRIPYAWNAPIAITGGDHTVSVAGTDAGGRTAEAHVTVHVTGACTASGGCGDGLHCLGGFCLPGADVDGGLGATCTGNDACITGLCGTNGDDQRCTGACDAGNACPDGYACLGANGGAGVCWPDGQAGGCATSPGGSPVVVFAGLGLLVILVRRRR